MKNLKPPVYDRANLIDFKRRLLWLNTVKESKTESRHFPVVQIALSILAVAALVTLIKIWG